MGTRTWSRKGVLTLAGMRRAGLVGEQSIEGLLDIGKFGTPSQYAPRPVGAATFEPNGDFAKALRQALVDDFIKQKKDRIQYLRELNNANPSAKLEQSIAEEVAAITEDAINQYMQELNAQSMAELIAKKYIISQAVLYDITGYNEKPASASWEDIENGTGIELINGEPVYGYRGITGYVSTFEEEWGRGKKAQDYMNDLRQGEKNRTKTGGAVNGMFIALVTPDPKQISQADAKEQAFATANLYGDAAGKSSEGRIFLVGMQKGAKTDIKEWLDFYKTHSPDERFYNPYIQKEFERRYGFRFPEGTDARAFIATALGYDGIVVQGHPTTNDPPPDGSPHFAVLNRGKIVVSNTEIVKPGYEY